MHDLPDLTELRLEASPVTSATIEFVAGLAALEILDLSDTKIDDAAVPYILELSKLQELDVSGTGGWPRSTSRRPSQVECG